MFKSSSLSNTHAKDNNQVDDLRFISRVVVRDGYEPEQTLTTERHKTLVEAMKYLIVYARINKLHPIYDFYYIKDMKTGQEVEFRMYADDAYNQFRLQEYPGSDYSAEFKAAFNTSVAQDKAASSALSSSVYQVFSNLLGYGSPAAAPLVSSAKPAAKASPSHAAAAAASSPAPVSYISPSKPAAAPKLPNYQALISTITSDEDAFRCCVSSINDGNGEQLRQIIEAYPGVIRLKSQDKHSSPLLITTLYKIRTLADALPSVTKSAIAYRNIIESLLQAAQLIVRNDAFDYRVTDAYGNTPMHRVFWYAIFVEDQAISDRLIQIGLDMLRKIRSAEFRSVLNQKNRNDESCRNNIELTDAYRSKFTPNQQRNYSRLHEVLRTQLLVAQPDTNKSYDFSEKTFVEYYEDAISDELISLDLMQDPLTDLETGTTLDKSTWENLKTQGENHPKTRVPFTEDSYKKLLPNQRIKELTDIFNEHQDDVEQLFEVASRYMSLHPLTTLEEKFDMDPQLKSVYQLIQQYAVHQSALKAESASVSASAAAISPEVLPLGYTVVVNACYDERQPKKGQPFLNFEESGNTLEEALRKALQQILVKQAENTNATGRPVDAAGGGWLNIVYSVKTPMNTDIIFQLKGHYQKTSSGSSDFRDCKGYELQDAHLHESSLVSALRATFIELQYTYISSSSPLLLGMPAKNSGATLVHSFAAAAAVQIEQKPTSALSVNSPAAAPNVKGAFFASASALSVAKLEQYNISSTQADRLLAELVVRLLRNDIVAINKFVDGYVKKLPANYQTVFMSYIKAAKERYQPQHANGYPEKDQLIWLQLILQGDKLSNTLPLLLHVENIEITLVSEGKDVDYRVMLTSVQRECIEEIIAERLVFLQSPKPFQK